MGEKVVGRFHNANARALGQACTVTERRKKTHHKIHTFFGQRFDVDDVLYLEKMRLPIARIEDCGAYTELYVLSAHLAHCALKWRHHQGEAAWTCEGRQASPDLREAAVGLSPPRASDRG